MGGVINETKTEAGMTEEMQSVVQEDDNPIGSFIHRDLIVVGLDAKDKDEAVRHLAGLMLAKGCVKESYADAVLTREKSFPTGLPTMDVHVAIPHTDVVHCNQPAIAVGILNHPIEFYEMATLDVLVHPEIIFLLSIVKPKDQVVWLSRLVTLFQQEGFLKQLRACVEADVVYETLGTELERLREAGE